MRLFALVCMVLAAISAPALAQTTPPPPAADEPGGFTPGTIALAAVGVGLVVWGITAVTKKSSTTPAACTSSC
jgi:hypothetical protein